MPERFANPRHGLSESEAALFVGISATKFRELVTKNLMPKPRIIGTRRLWSIDALRVAFEELPEDGATVPDTWGDLGRDTAAAR